MFARLHCKVVLIALPIFLSACAADQPLIKQTQSGYAEGTFENSSLASVENKLVGACSRTGAMVSDANTSEVVCSETMEGQSAVLSQLLLGNSSSTTPVRKVRFVMYTDGSSVHVTVYEWVETQMAFGQVRKAELKSNGQRNELQQLLTYLGAD